MLYAVVICWFVLSVALLLAGFHFDRKPIAAAGCVMLLMLCTFSS